MNKELWSPLSLNLSSVPDWYHTISLISLPKEIQNYDRNYQLEPYKFLDLCNLQKPKTLYLPLLSYRRISFFLSRFFFLFLFFYAQFYNKHLRILKGHQIKELTMFFQKSLFLLIYMEERMDQCCYTLNTLRYYLYVRRFEILTPVLP